MIIAAAAFMTRFFHDVVPWWHLISPAFVIFVVLPLLYWSTTKRGDWSGWNGLAQSYGVDEWPGDASDLGAPRYCCLLYTSPSPRDKRQSRMPSSA